MITFEFQNNTFRATGTYTPGDPGQLFGPPEHCWEPYAPEYSFNTLEVWTGTDWVDALWVLDTELGDKIHDAVL